MLPRSVSRQLSPSAKNRITILADVASSFNRAGSARPLAVASKALDRGKGDGERPMKSLAQKVEPRRHSNRGKTEGDGRKGRARSTAIRSGGSPATPSQIRRSALETAGREAPTFRDKAPAIHLPFRPHRKCDRCDRGSVPQPAAPFDPQRHERWRRNTMLSGRLPFHLIEGSFSIRRMVIDPKELAFWPPEPEAVDY